MQQVDFIPFHTDMLDIAANLLAERHRRDQQAQPLFSLRFIDVDIARQAIASQWQRPWSSGVAAFAGDRMIGYLIGYMQVDQFFGRAVWSRLAGHAIATDVDSDLYRDLYAAAAPTWLGWGCFDHLILVPATTTYLEPWSLLSFGRMHAYGAMALADIETTPTVPDNVTIRMAGPDDAEVLRGMSGLTAGHQLHAPVWALTPPESMAERPAQYAGIVDDDEVTCWLAFVEEVDEEDGTEVAAGFQAWYPAELDADALHIPEAALELAAAGVHSQWRGRGISRALFIHALDQAKQEGYRHAITDWRTTNLLSSRAWPRLGFEPVMYRLHRHVDERIAWGEPVGQ